MAPIGAKLGQNAFQTIPNVSFFDTEKKFWMIFFPKNFGTRFFFQETGVSDEPGIFERHQQIRLQKLLQEVCFWGDFLGGGVNDSICVETLDLAPKLTSTIWCCDVMIICYVDAMIR